MRHREYICQYIEESGSMTVMEKAEKIFWGIAAVAAVYVVFGTTFNIGTKVNAQQQAPAQQVVAQAPAQGMGCMAKGGGCGCGGMMKKAQ
jgi:hypothetical protein